MDIQAKLFNISDEEKIKLSIKTKDKEIIAHLSHEQNWKIRLNISQNDKTPVKVLLALTKDKNNTVVEAAIFSLSTRNFSARDLNGTFEGVKVKEIIEGYKNTSLKNDRISKLLKD